MSRRIREPRIDVDCRGLVDSHGPHKPVRICLHDTESHDVKGIGDLAGIARFWQAQGRGYGAQIGVDAEGHSARYVNDTLIAWHVGGINTGTLGVEQIGFARWGKAVWVARPRQLEKVARWLAYWHVEYGIPLKRARFDEATGLMGPGVFTHKDWSDVSALSDHWDPGYGYPTTFVIWRARQLVRQGGWS
ncbi:MAG: peptidoglycan recognition family protein [Acidimicrobiales bacterium]